MSIMTKMSFFLVFYQTIFTASEVPTCHADMTTIFDLTSANIRSGNFQVAGDALVKAAQIYFPVSSASNAGSVFMKEAHKISDNFNIEFDFIFHKVSCSLFNCQDFDGGMALVLNNAATKGSYVSDSSCAGSKSIKFVTGGISSLVDLDSHVACAGKYPLLIT